MGRPKGLPNRPKRRLLQLLQEKYPDYHPVLEMAKVANNEDADQRTRFEANREVAKYVEPVLKAVEHSNDSDAPLSITLTVVEN